MLRTSSSAPPSGKPPSVPEKSIASSNMFLSLSSSEVRDCDNSCCGGAVEGWPGGLVDRKYKLPFFMASRIACSCAVVRAEGALIGTSMGQPITSTSNALSREWFDHFISAFRFPDATLEIRVSMSGS